MAGENMGEGSGDLGEALGEAESFGNHGKTMVLTLDMLLPTQLPN